MSERQLLTGVMQVKECEKRDLDETVAFGGGIQQGFTISSLQPGRIRKIGSPITECNMILLQITWSVNDGSQDRDIMNYLL